MIFSKFPPSAMVRIVVVPVPLIVPPVQNNSVVVRLPEVSVPPSTLSVVVMISES